MDPCRTCGTAGIVTCPNRTGEGRTRKSKALMAWVGRLSGYSVTIRTVIQQGRSPASSARVVGGSR